MCMQGVCYIHVDDGCMCKLSDLTRTKSAASPVRLNLLAIVQYFSLITKQQQPAYQPQKTSTE
jgi:hypothetical protein